MTVCVEVTERALTQRPGALLAHVADMRAMGVAIALDDVGTDADTLAMMALLAPEVIKLDLALVQSSPDADIAEVVHAVAAQAERSGATILVEGVETPAAGAAGFALGATPRAGLALRRAARSRSCFPTSPAPRSSWPGRHADPRDLAPFALVAEQRTPRLTDAPLLLAMTQHLEEQARGLGRTRCSSPPSTRTAASPRACRAATPSSAATSRSAASSAAACRPSPRPAFTAAQVLSRRPDQPRWAIAVVGPHFAAALVAHERRGSAPGAEQEYDYVLTYDRERATAVAAALTARVAA